VQETFRAAEKEGERGACTAIYFLLAEGQKSHWHKVDAVETWLWHSGAGLHAPKLCTVISHSQASGTHRCAVGAVHLRGR